ncbi:MAG: LON peptidase substrate-binding domain-containing protein [Alphaproteobacteria bacterium]|nr:LON peptidase substrate-binding domain-containing protein [Alphaproteobacteria bacterium]MBF0250616.1 LON peptidase substrate-binding domain-containing protein [Alphaproteobacteria bacterium]
MTGGVRNPLDLPSRMPVFPVSGAILLPFGQLPLTVFEPRYLHLVDDALGRGRIVAMVQPRLGVDEPVHDDAPLYAVGTAARIVHFQETGDGRYLITLEGMARFRVAAVSPAEPGRGYRWVDADYAPYRADVHPTEHETGPGRDRLLELMRVYFDDKAIEADWSAVADAPYEALVASLAMSCPFEPTEKQALLECARHEQRAEMLISLFEMSAIQPDVRSVRH